MSVTRLVVPKERWDMWNVISVNWRRNDRFFYFFESFRYTMDSDWLGRGNGESQRVKDYIMGLIK